MLFCFSLIAASSGDEKLEILDLPSRSAECFISRYSFHFNGSEKVSVLSWETRRVAVSISLLDLIETLFASSLCKMDG